MVDVAQLVRAPGCGPGGRGFESHLSPHVYNLILGCSQAVRHQTLTLASRRFESSQPSQNGTLTSKDERVSFLHGMGGFENECELSEPKAKINEQATVQWTVALRGGSKPTQPSQ